jgi:hypothetical protein
MENDIKNKYWIVVSCCVVFQTVFYFRQHKLRTITLSVIYLLHSLAFRQCPQGNNLGGWMGRRLNVSAKDVCIRIPIQVPNCKTEEHS